MAFYKGLDDLEESSGLKNRDWVMRDDSQPLLSAKADPVVKTVEKPAVVNSILSGISHFKTGLPRPVALAEGGLVARGFLKAPSQSSGGFTRTEVDSSMRPKRFGHLTVCFNPLKAAHEVEVHQPSRYYVPSKRMGGRLSESLLHHADHSNPMVSGFLQYISYADFVRLVHLFFHSSESKFRDWIYYMGRKDFKLRCGRVAGALWSFFVAKREKLLEVETSGFGLPRQILDLVLIFPDTGVRTPEGSEKPHPGDFFEMACAEGPSRTPEPTLPLPRIDNYNVYYNHIVDLASGLFTWHFENWYGGDLPDVFCEDIREAYHRMLLDHLAGEAPFEDFLGWVCAAFAEMAYSSSHVQQVVMFHYPDYFLNRNVRELARITLEHNGHPFLCPDFLEAPSEGPKDFLPPPAPLPYSSSLLRERFQFASSEALYSVIAFYPAVMKMALGLHSILPAMWGFPVGDGEELAFVEVVRISIHHYLATKQPKEGVFRAIFDWVRYPEISPPEFRDHVATFYPGFLARPRTPQKALANLISSPAKFEDVDAVLTSLEVASALANPEGPFSIWQKKPTSQASVRTLIDEAKAEYATPRGWNFLSARSIPGSSARKFLARHFSSPEDVVPGHYTLHMEDWESAVRGAGEWGLDMLAVATTLCRVAKAGYEKNFLVFLEQVNVLRGLRKLGNSRHSTGFVGLFFKWRRIFDQLKESAASSVDFETRGFLVEEGDADGEDLDWAGATKELFSKFPHGSDGEEEEKHPDPVYVADEAFREGPEDIVLFRDFKALVFASLVPDVVACMPGFLVNFMSFVRDKLFLSLNFHSLGSSIVRFCSTTVHLMKEFVQNGYDFRIFLGNGGLSTWPMRVREVLKPTVARDSVSLSTHKKELELLVDEGMSYSKNRPLDWKNNEVNRMMLSALVSKLTSVESALAAAANRKRKPLGMVLIGPPGTGKTSLIQQLTHCMIQVDPRRGPGPKGDKEIQPNDIYPVSFAAKHWNNCKNPCTLLFNDLPGSGYVNNGASVNVPDMLRLAIDIEPFFTPQADIVDKKDCVIDPDFVPITSNDTIWNFDVYGYDWSKLIRRYKSCWYIAFPADFYRRDITPDGSDHGELINPYSEVDDATYPRLRVYRMKMTHSAGRLSFKRVGEPIPMFKFVADRKKEILAHLAKPLDGFDSRAVCRAGEALAQHPRGVRCVPGVCDAPEQIAAGEVEAVDSREEGAHALPARPEGPFPCGFQGVVSSIVDESIDRALDRHRSVFEDLKRVAIVGLATVGAAVAAVSAMTAFAVSRAGSGEKEKGKEETPTTPAASATGEALVNPVKAELGGEIILRYGLADGKDLVPPPTSAKTPVWPRTAGYTVSKQLSTSYDDVVRLIGNNEVWLISEDSSVWGTMIEPTLLLINAHNLRLLPQTFAIGVRDNPTPLYYCCTDRVVIFEDFDEAWIKVPTTSFRSISHLIPTSFGGASEGEWGIHPGKERKLVPVSLGLFYFPDKSSVPVRGYRFPKTSVSGDCGRPCAIKVGGSGVFAGIHAASNDSYSYSLAVHHSRYAEAASRLGVIKEDVNLIKVLAEGPDPLFGGSQLRAGRRFPGYVLGTAHKSTVTRKSSFVETPLHGTFFSQLGEPYTIPRLKVKHEIRDGVYYSPMTHKMKGFEDVPEKISTSELESGVAAIVNQAREARVHPLLLIQAISGVEGASLLRGMNLSTSAGLFGAKKSDFLDKSGFINANLLARSEDLLALLELGPVADYQKYCLKDEIIKLSKDDVLKFRYFMVSGIEFLLVCRMFLSPILQEIYLQRDVFCAYGAFNALSPEFAKMFSSAKRFARAMALDISHMDSSHRAFMADAIGDLFYKLAVKWGYNDRAALIVRNCVRSIVFSIAEVNGDLAFFVEGMGSGIYLTFIFNCLVILLLYLVAWRRLDGRDGSFWEKNFLAAGGDDSFATTSDERFTAIYVASVFREYGYVVTPARKGEELQPWEPFDSVVFLKRTLKQVETPFGLVETGALAKDSIFKSLCWRNEFSGTTARQRDSDTIESARFEAALHGREFFDKFCADLDAIDYARSLPYRRYTFEEIFERYLSGDPIIYPENNFIDKWELSPSYSSEVAANITLATPEGPGVPFQGFFRSTLVVIFLAVLQVTSATLPSDQAFPAISSGKATAFGLATIFQEIYPFLSCEVDRGEFSSLTDSVTSQTPMVGSDHVNMSTEKTATFDMQSAVVSGEVPDPSFASYAKPKTDLTIQESLSRPVWLYTLTWSAATATFTQLSEVYNEWKTDSFVQSKLDGYKFFRGKPKIRLLVNGCSFWYGKALVAFDLTPGNDGLLGSYNSQIPTVRMRNVVQAAMAPHISIDPSVSATYDISLPFFSATGWYNRFLPNSQLPGILPYFAVIAPLSSVNSTPPGSVTMQMYFYMEDVELSVPAASPAQAMVGSSLTEEETLEVLAGAHSETLPGPVVLPGALSETLPGEGSGEISEPPLPTLEEPPLPAGAEGPEEVKPSSILKWAATATSAAGPALGIGAWVSPLLSAMSSAAKAFGYSAAPAIDAQVEKNNPSLTVVSGPVPVDRLVHDPKQGIAISAVAAGAGEENDMDLLELAKKPGLLDQLQWPVAGFLPHTIYINPSTWTLFPGVIPSGPDPRYQLLPISYAAWAYSYWTGTIIIDIEVVASGFHRGCIGVSFVPYVAGLPAGVLDYPNRFQTTIIDVNQTRFSSIEIPYVGDTLWTGCDNGSGIFGNYMAGQLVTYVINGLVTLGSNSPVYINYYIRAGKDFSLAKPTVEKIRNCSFIDLAQAEGPEHATINDHEDVPQSLIAPVDNHRFLLNFGENITSIKQLIQRTELIAFRRAPGFFATSGTIAIRFELPVLFPPCNDDRTTYPLSCATLNDFYSWFSVGFGAVRGGQRLLIRPNDAIQNYRASGGSAINYKLSYSDGTRWIEPLRMTFSDAEVMVYMTGDRGQSSDRIVLKNGAFVEVPPLFKDRFINPRKFISWFKPDTNKELPVIKVFCENIAWPEAANGVAGGISVYRSASDDTSFHLFLYVPLFRITALSFS